MIQEKKEGLIIFTQNNDSHEIIYLYCKKYPFLDK